MSAQPRIALLSSLTPEITAEIISVKARDRIAHGWGIDQRVVSVVAHSRRIVVVEDVYYTLDLSVTVHDFLLEFLKQRLGPVWGTEELAKPYPERHPVLQWHDHNSTRSRLLRKNIPDGITVPIHPTGPIAALYSLACDLFTIANNRLLDEKLLRRLRRNDLFQGARYELYTRAFFLRGGFGVELENEDDRNESHCEFTASSKQSGKRFSVEAKSRHRAGLLGQSGVRESEESIRLDFSHLLSEALGKSAKHIRIIFIDVNLPASDPMHPIPHWFSQLERIVEKKERLTLEDGARLPPCYLVITNQPYHYGVAEAEAPNTRFLVAGFNFPGYRELTGEQLLIRHPVVAELVRAAASNSALPVTFPQNN